MQLVYVGDAPGQAREILIDGVKYARGNQPFELEENEAIRLLSIGGFYEVDELVVDEFYEVDELVVDESMENETTEAEASQE